MIGPDTFAQQMGRFATDETGLALTEYLLLLGLVTGGVVLTVVAFGQSMGQTWTSWAEWVSRSFPEPPQNQ
jgi:pilus assembly protein Flp/PilA